MFAVWRCVYLRVHIKRGLNHKAGFRMKQMSDIKSGWTEINVDAVLTQLASLALALLFTNHKL